MSGHQGTDKVKLEDDIVAEAGYWEPVSVLIRGGVAYDGLEDDKYPYSPEMAEKLCEIGINLAIWPYYKAIGIENEEQEEMQKTAEFFKHLDKYGITKGVYINQGTIFQGPFLAENPEARDWVALDPWGKPQPYSEFYRSYHKQRICAGNTEFGRFYGRVCIKAIKEAGADFIHFDQAAQVPCYCEKCKTGYPKYVLGKYPNESREGAITFKQRFGYKYYGHLDLPKGSPRQPIDNLPTAYEPGLYEWVRYRQQLYENTFKIACDMIKDASGETQICWNIALDYGEFTSLVWGIDPETSYRCGTEYFFSEDSNFAGMEEGRLIGHIRTYKYGRAMNNRVIVHNMPPSSSDDAKLLNYAEAAVFNDGCLGRVMWATDPDDGRLDLLKKVLKFLRRNKDVYIHTKSISRVALYRCAESELANWADERISRLAVEQVLIKNSIQYDNIINDRFEEVSNYDLLICANTATVSNAVVRKIADFVRGGGKLLCTESALSRNEYGRNRKYAPHMLMQDERDSEVNRVKGRADVSGILEYLRLEEKYAANIFYLPAVDYTKQFVWDPTSARLPIIGKEYFVEPFNKDELLGLLREALGEDDVEVSAPENVIAGYFECAEGQRVVHILDYRPGRRLAGVGLRFKINGDKKKQAKFVTLDSEFEIELEYNGDYASCVLPAFKTYGFLKTTGN